MKSEHTPTLKVINTVKNFSTGCPPILTARIETSDGLFVVENLDRKLAALIVRAVNSHDELLKAVKGLERWVANVILNDSAEARRSKPNDIDLAFVDMVIAKAEGKL